MHKYREACGKYNNNNRENCNDSLAVDISELLGAVVKCADTGNHLHHAIGMGNNLGHVTPMNQEQAAAALETAIV